MHVNTKRTLKRGSRGEGVSEREEGVRKKERQAIFSLDNQRKKGESRKKLSFW